MPLRVCASTFPPPVRRGHRARTGDDQAIDYAGNNGADVANLSLDGPDAEPLVIDAFARHPDTLYVISAGNDGWTTTVAMTPGGHHYPATTPRPATARCPGADRQHRLRRGDRPGRSARGLLGLRRESVIPNEVSGASLRAREAAVGAGRRPLRRSRWP